MNNKEKEKALKWFETYIIGSDPILITESQFYKWRIEIDLICKALQEPEQISIDDIGFDRSCFIIAYAACALSGAAIGFIIGVMI